MLNENEKVIADKIRQLKQTSGSHSPSIYSLISEIEGFEIAIDACFLSNPYATDLFMRYFKEEVLNQNKLRGLLEFYPTQNRPLAAILSSTLGVDPECIFLGNGATEIIQTILHRFTKKKLLVTLPTFSPYYEFARSDTEVIFYTLDKRNDFKFDPDAWLKIVKKEKCDTVVLINPNNPDGGYLSQKELRTLLGALKEVDQVILDESFLHFSSEDSSCKLISNLPLLKEFPNLITIKSMSKDFGIAGIRAGYAIMPKEKVKELLKNGFLWNVSGLAEYFFRLYSTKQFREEYEQIRIKHLQGTQDFFKQLNAIKGINVYPSQANFFLIELPGVSSSEVALELLIRHGIYTRACDDKKGLEGSFIRIASRTPQENMKIAHCLSQVVSSHAKDPLFSTPM